MSFTFTLSGCSSTLQSQFFPPLCLHGEWEVGLLNLETYNSIPNIKNGDFLVDGMDQFIEVPIGAYELKDLEEFINKSAGSSVIQIHGNRNTLKTEITCTKWIKVNDELATLLGFEGEQIFQVGTINSSTKPANITKVNVIRVDCNIAKDSYLNGKPTHTIFEFAPRVPPGFRIIEVPQTVIYNAINTSQLDTLKLNVVDQNDHTVDFRGETLTIRVHIRKKQ